MTDKIPIAMPTYNRPHYLRQTLGALRGCASLDRFRIITSEEEHDATRALWGEVAAEGWIDVERHTHPGVWGCARNVVAASDYGAAAGPWFLLLEDDMLLADDALDMAIWCAGILTDHPDVHSFNLYSQDLKALPGADYDPNVLRFNDWFTCRVWGAASDMWRRVRADYDPCRERCFERTSWAWPVNVWRNHHKLWSINPALSRVQYIGEHGTFGDSNNFQDKVVKAWVGDWPHKNKLTREYRLTSAERERRDDLPIRKMGARFAPAFREGWDK